MGIVLGIKNQKGTVSVENFKNRIRLRWRYQGKRFSLSLWRLFTLLGPGQNDSPGLPWYGLLKEMGYIEKNGTLMKKYLYDNTGSRENEMVNIAEDYSLIVIFKSDDTINEYYR